MKVSRIQTCHWSPKLAEPTTR